MVTESVSARIDYLQRCGAAADLPVATSHTCGDPTSRRLLLVRGISRPPRDPRTAASGERENWRPPTTELITGLYGYRIPLVYLVQSTSAGVEVSLGVWPTVPTVDPARQDGRLNVVDSVLRGLYPAIDLAPHTAPRQRHRHGAIAVGVPAPSGVDERDGATPIDRIIRSMAGSEWSLLVLAQPLAEHAIITEREAILNEMRTVMSAAKNEAAPSPLTEHYIELLKVALEATGMGMATGAWRVGIYLLGDGDSHPRLSSGWRSVMSGPKSLPEPVRTVDINGVDELARLWALPTTPGAPAPGLYRRPFEFQTLLASTQLAKCFHLPELETPGFRVSPAPTFSVSRPQPNDSVPAIDIGQIMNQRRPSALNYRVELDQLTRHTFIAGLTGAGKTNTLMHLLTQAASAGVPFLVIEPAKTEYRELLGHKAIGNDVRVFTVGREHVAPLRLNPLEVAPGVDVSTHLDLLKAVFTASFALWVPLPQVLEQCLVEIYTERGWDFGSSNHPPLDGFGQPPTPRLRDLVAAVERTVPSLGYKHESTQEITASLTTRLNALRRGGRGLMLDIERSIPMAEILRKPTVIELESLGDDADKAFVMGLLLIRLYEHRRAAHAAATSTAARAGAPPPAPGRLRHLVVVEEAHRLLGSERKQTDAWTADPKGAFVDTFCQMLSEVRAYGQGIVVADQVPVRLAPDVLKNTNLKIAHRLVVGDDREAMAKAMAMTTEQSNELTIMPPGRAAVFSEGDHTPVIVQVPKSKDNSTHAAIDDSAVSEAMAKWRSDPSVQAWFTASVACRGACRNAIACKQSSILMEHPHGQLLATRLWHTSIEHPDGIDLVWPDITAFVKATAAGIGEHTSPPTPGSTNNLDDRVHSFALHAIATVTNRRAMQAGWSSPATSRLTTLLFTAIEERSRQTEYFLGDTPARQEVVTAAAKLQTRAFDPLPLCSKICSDGRCPFLHAVRDVRAASGNFLGDANTDDELLNAATALAEEIVETPRDAPSATESLNQARWRAIACATQLLAGKHHRSQESTRRTIQVMGAAGWDLATASER